MILKIINQLLWFLQEILNILYRNSFFPKLFLKSLYAAAATSLRRKVKDQHKKRGFLLELAVEFGRRFLVYCGSIKVDDFLKLRKTFDYAVLPWDWRKVSVSSEKVTLSDKAWEEIGRFCHIEKNPLTAELSKSPISPYDNNGPISPKVILHSITASPIHPEQYFDNLKFHQNGVPMMSSKFTSEFVERIEKFKSSQTYLDLQADIIKPVNKHPSGHMIYYVHGGGLFFCSSKTHRLVISTVSILTGLSCLSVDYRLCPDHEFPAALEDVVKGYFYLTHEKSIKPEAIHIVSDSAGSSLSLALIFYLQDNNLKLPRSISCISPMLDMTCRKKSWIDNAKFDILINPNYLGAMSPIAYYGKEFMKHPYVSPLFRTDLSRLPPISIHAGESECLIDEIEEFCENLGKSKVSYEFHKFPEMPHCFQFLAPFSDATNESFMKLSRFILSQTTS